jgi:predicted RNase H-like HicB family nuclease
LNSSVGHQKNGKWRQIKIITTKTNEVNILNRFTLPVIIEKDKDGYFAFCPDLQGCYTQGDSYEEVLSNIEDAIRLHIEDRLENGESIPISEMVSLTTLEVLV